MSSDVRNILPVPLSDATFTPRQLQVLKLMIEGLNNRQIGKALGLSTYTARFHVSKIISKLGVSNRTEAVVVALEEKLVESKDM